MNNSINSQSNDYNSNSNNSGINNSNSTNNTTSIQRILASSAENSELRQPISQLVGVVDLNSFIQSNSFLRSDLGDLVNSDQTQNFLVLPNMNNQYAAGTSRDQNVNLTQSNSNVRSHSAFFNNQPQNHAHTHTHSHSHSLDQNQVNTNNSNEPVVLTMFPNNNNSNPNNDGQDTQYQNALNANQQQFVQEQAASSGIYPFIIKTMQSSLPFLLIIIAKIFHQHLLGFFVVLGFLTTLHWSNRSLVNQVELKDKKQNHKLILLILFLLLNVVVFFFIFKDYKLQNCLILLSTNIHKMDTWNLVWIVVCSDTIIKFLIISIKSLITLLPFKIVPLRKRGSYYSIIETFALFYRCLTPIHPWILFLLYSETNIHILKHDAVDLSSNNQLVEETEKNSLKAFPIFLCILYLIFKINQLYARFNELTQSFRDLVGEMTYATPVSIKENEDNTCPICQDTFSNPVILKCKHVFCQDCVCVWLDKENSCPMCRAKIGIKKPKFKDGSTTILIQWF